MDFAEPITAGDAVRYAASELDAKAKRLRSQSEFALARAEEVEGAAQALHGIADRFDEWQPPAAVVPKEAT